MVPSQLPVANYLCAFCDYVTLDVIFSDKIKNSVLFCSDVSVSHWRSQKF